MDYNLENKTVENFYRSTCFLYFNTFGNFFIYVKVPFK